MPWSRVLIAGGGVGALELMLALRELAPGRVDVELLAPGPEFTYRPLAVAEAFGVGEVRSFELAPIVADCGARLRAGALAGVDPARHRAIATDGSELEYGKLAIATGAIQRASLPGALTFEGSGQKEAFQTVLAELVGGEVESVAFALPSGIAWALPLYELALMTAVYLDRHGARGAKLSLVTPEDTPLLTGRAPAYFRADIGGGAGDPREVEAEPLWWPPGKIAGRYLSRYLATLMAEEPPESAAGIRVELDDLQSLLR